MVIYDRTPSTGYRRIDEFDGGFGWLAHPDEAGMRASHALLGDGDDVWLFDPLEAPGIDEAITSLGEVAGVVVCSAYHARDADRFARRFDVPVLVPAWLDRVAERIDAPLERFEGRLADSGVDVREVSPVPAGPRRSRTGGPITRCTCRISSEPRRRISPATNGSRCTC